MTDNVKLKDRGLDDLILRIIKESSSTLSHIAELRKYFDPFYKKPEKYEAPRRRRQGISKEK
jgi:hypothetical protein